MKEVVQTDQAPRAIGPYNQATVAGGFVFTAGQLGLDPSSGELADGVAGQTRRALENLREVLAAAGASLDDVVKTMIYLDNMNDFAQVNEVYSAYFGKNAPARSTVEVTAMPKGALVEIEMVAYVGKG